MKTSTDCLYYIRTSPEKQDIQKNFFENVFEKTKSDIVLLEQHYEKGKKWNERKKTVNEFADFLKNASVEYNIPIFAEMSEKMKSCASYVAFAKMKETGDYKLIESNFCRSRFCPICRWRRAMKLKARFSQIYPELTENYKNSRYIFITFGIKNCTLDDLPSVLDLFVVAFRRLVQRNEVKSSLLGYIKNIEVPRQQNSDLVHPHLHCIFHVDEYYYKKNYLNHKRWKELWQESLRIDYEPSVFLSSIKDKTGVENIVSYITDIMGYSMKLSDFHYDAKWFEKYVYAVFNRRFFSTAGSIRIAYKELDNLTDFDMVQVDENGKMLDIRWNELYEKIQCIRYYRYDLKYGYIHVQDSKPFVCGMDSITNMTYGDYKKSLKCQNDLVSIQLYDDFEKIKSSLSRLKNGIDIALKDFPKDEWDLWHIPKSDSIKLKSQFYIGKSIAIPVLKIENKKSEIIGYKYNFIIKR